MSLAGSGSLLELTRLRFHLGTESARLRSSHAKLSDNGRTILTTFLSQMGMGNQVSPERRHALLGQAYLNTVLSLPLGGIIMRMGDATVFPALSLTTTVLRGSWNHFVRIFLSLMSWKTRITTEI